MKPTFKTKQGHPLPLGVSIQPDGLNFAIFSRHATHVWLLLFESEKHDPLVEIELDPAVHRTGDVWHILLSDLRGLHPAFQADFRRTTDLKSALQHLKSTLRYGYRMDRQPNEAPHIYRFDPNEVLIDPYAKALTGGERWGVWQRRQGDDHPKISSRNVEVRKYRNLIIEDDFDWGADRPLNRPMSELVIYELHVRGFTRHKSAQVDHPGTYRGLIEKIPYLKNLGINAVELLPIFEFEELDRDTFNPQTGERHLNFWGYHPINFFAPKAGYAAEGKNGNAVREFKEMVKAFHQAGIEVILDVVFNHTGEGDETGHIFSFKGIDNPIYYMLDEQGHYRNYAGCGNVLNCNYPVVHDLIIDALRYWVTEMHIDGFRFDLASILTRGRDGQPMANPALIDHITADPILADTKLIAEAWDAAGLYQVGTFPAWGRWAEWNGKYRDDIRRFVKSDPGLVPALAQRLLGSPDIYEPSGRHPFHSINFITCHDGFTLHDLVSYNEKHNWENGEQNQDGSNDNYSWNCGVEGETDNPQIQRLRRQQMKNFLTLLMLSNGVPLLTAGDEFARTQQGNNNAYCHDSPLTWVDWTLADKHAELFRFTRELIAFRHEIKHLRLQYYHDPAVEIYFHGVKLHEPDWSYDSRSLAMQIISGDKRHRIQQMMIICNAHWESLKFELPILPKGKKWHLKIDTSFVKPYDIMETGKEKSVRNPQHYKIAARSTVVLVAKSSRKKK